MKTGPNFSLLNIFSSAYFHFSKKGQCPQRKIIIGIFFRNRDFHFKIRFGPSWIDFDQKKIRKVFDFFGQFWPWNRFFNFWDDKFEFFSPISWGLHCGHFALLHASPTIIELCSPTRFIEFLIKNSPKLKVKYIFLRNGGSQNFRIGLIRNVACVILHNQPSLYELRCGRDAKNSRLP